VDTGKAITLGAIFLAALLLAGGIVIDRRRVA
jgi:outer membrane murein-binding lipoprotein Lpp